MAIRIQREKLEKAAKPVFVTIPQRQQVSQGPFDYPIYQYYAILFVF